MLKRKYSTSEREGSAAVWAASKFRLCIFGRPFLVLAHHNSLIWLFAVQDSSSRLARLAITLQQFHVTILYKSGDEHCDADCLSCYPRHSPVVLKELILSVAPIMSKCLENFVFSEEQRRNETLLPIIEFHFGNRTEITPRVILRAKLFPVVDEVLCCRKFKPSGCG